MQHKPLKQMTVLCLVVSLALMNGCRHAPPTARDGDQFWVAEVVNGLGRQPARNPAYFAGNVDSIRRLSKHSRTAVNVLVAELRPVSIVKLDKPGNAPRENREARHIMWCLRALYYITGKNSLAKTRCRFTDSELDEIRSSLIVNSKNKKVSFFTEWMSRGTLYFAPTDAQISIIEEWKTWLRYKSDDQKYRTDAELDEWHFGGPEQL